MKLGRRARKLGSLQPKKIKQVVYWRVGHYIGFKGTTRRVKWCYIGKELPNSITRQLITQKEQLITQQFTQNDVHEKKRNSSLDLKTRNTMFVNACWGRGLAWLEKIEDDFRDFCEVDRNLAKSTTKLHLWRLNKIARHIKKPLAEISVRDVRSFLRSMKEYYKESTYSGFIKTIRVFFRDYLDRPELVKSFKFPSIPFELKTIPTKEELRQFYNAIDRLVVRTMFLMWATSGLRRKEVWKALKNDVDIDKRMIIPSNHGTSRTKKSWVSFLNQEAKEMLVTYLSSRTDDEPRLFRISYKTFFKTWKDTRINTGLDISPKMLRDWFCVEMGELGVPDRYVDAFCGRVPKSILARHYTDYSPQRLKRIYDKAGLTVLS